MVFLLGTVTRFALSFLLLSSVAHAAEFEEPACDPSVDTCTSDLNLLQKKASVVKAGSKMARDESKPALVKEVVKDVSKIKITAEAKMSLTAIHKEQCSHSKTSAFVMAARGPVVASMTHEHRLSMLSTTEASPLSEATKGAIIAACSIVLMLFIAATVVTIVVETRGSGIFKDIVKEGIETIAEDVLGLEVTVGSVEVGVMKGSIRITDLKIANPPDWKTECFLKSNTVDVRLNLWSYAFKRFFGREFDVVVDDVVFRDVDLNVERSASATNVKHILDMVNVSKVKPVLKNNCKLTLHKMTIADARAKVPFWGQVAVPTVHCKDFDKATEGKAKALHPIVVELLREFCMTGEWASELVQQDQLQKPIAVVA